jgi:hypothetical protein
VVFERYADDVIVHLATERQVESVLVAIESRMLDVGLQLHPAKTRIVYCKDGRRRLQAEPVEFTFLGLAFRARAARSRTGVVFTHRPAATAPPGTQWPSYLEGVLCVDQDPSGACPPT